MIRASVMIDLVGVYHAPSSNTAVFGIAPQVIDCVKDVDNKLIPTICAVLGLLLAIWISGTVTPAVMLGGLFSGLAATGLHQVFVQIIDKK